MARHRIHAASTQNLMVHEHCVQHALSLIAYAQEDALFKNVLHTELDRVELDRSMEVRPYPILSLSRWLLPRDHAHAYERMQWVLSEAVRDPARARSARALLATWRHEYAKPEPKNIVIGLIGFAIPGPTLGIIKRTRNDAVRIIVRDDIALRSTTKVAKVAHTASLGLLADQLRRVHGYAYRLDPDMAHWFFGERSISLFHAPQSTLDELVLEARDERLPVHVLSSGNAEAIAFSPMVQAGFLVGRNVTPLP